MPAPPAPRPIEGWNDERLRNYYQLCRRTLRAEIPRVERLRRDLELLSKGAFWKKVKAGGGVALFAAGLVTTAIVGPVGAILTGLSAAASLEPVNSVVRESRARERLRLDIDDLEQLIEFWRREQARVIAEWRRRGTDPESTA